MLSLRGKGSFFTGPPPPAPCQVRSRTESPCPRRAAVEIRGVGFCGPCAREQKAYFAIGEFVAREGAQGPRGKQLAEVLVGIRRERSGGGEDLAAGAHRRPSDVYETKRPALRAS